MTDPRPHRETDLYPALRMLFARCSMAFLEVPFARKSIDLVFSTGSLRCLHAVEAKVGDWRNGLKQAALNQLFAQRAYLAVPKPLGERLIESQRTQFNKFGVGLISVGNGRAELVIPARRVGAFRRGLYREVKWRLLRAEAAVGTNTLQEAIDDIANGQRSLKFLPLWDGSREKAVQAMA